MKNKDHNLKTNSVYLFKLLLCVRPYTSQLFFCFERAEDGGSMKKQGLPCGHRLAWNLRDSLASAAQAGFRGNRPSWLTYTNCEEWAHWAHLTGKENKAQGRIYTHPKEQSQYPKHGACLQRMQSFHYSTHMVMGNENKGYKSAATDSAESTGKGGSILHLL